MATYQDIGVGKKLQKKVRLILTSLDANSNKFYDIFYYEDGTAQCKNGRVGDNGVWQKELTHYGADVVRREKEHKGYREVAIVADGDIVGSTQRVTVSAPARSGSNFEDTIVEHLGAGDPVLERLFRTVVRANRHSLERHLGITDDSGNRQASSMTYNVQTGQWSTALGVVTPETVQNARVVLNRITSYIGAGNTRDPQFTRMVNDYLMLIPQNFGRARTTAADLMGTMSAIDKQVALLDGLEASVQLAAPAPTATVKADKPKPKFQVEVALATPAEVAQWQQQYVNGSRIAAQRDSSHQGRSVWKIAHMYKINILPMTSVYDDLRAVEKLFGYPAMALWHSTGIGNVLSILTRGFMLPQSVVNGWAYGPGVYFSDVGTKSTNYCEGTPAFSFIAHVNMGRTYEETGWGSSGIPLPVKQGKYDTTWAVGKTHLEAMGKKVDHHSGGVIHNEMIVYDVRRIKPVYLVEWDRGKSGW